MGVKVWGTNWRGDFGPLQNLRFTTITIFQHFGLGMKIYKNCPKKKYGNTGWSCGSFAIFLEFYWESENLQLSLEGESYIVR